MSYVVCFASCINCNRPFAFNPNKVPSIFVHGVREPVCQDCVERANPIRKQKGLPEIEVQPGAYESADESEIVW